MGSYTFYVTKAKHFNSIIYSTNSVTVIEKVVGHILIASILFIGALSHVLRIPSKNIKHIMFVMSETFKDTE